MVSIRIPMIVDLVGVTDPDAISTIALDPRLDREFKGQGPLVNRLVLRRVRRILQVGGKPLPPVAPAGDPDRLHQQIALETKLKDAPVDQEAVAALTAYVLGKSKSDPGVAAQRAIGRLYAAGYEATANSFAAARVLSGSVQGFVSPRAWLWALTGRLRRSRALLSDMVGGDRSGVHATGIAVHNLVESIKRMRSLAEEPQALQRYAPEEAALLCLSAPKRVLREAVRGGTNEAVDYRRGTLLTLGLESARARDLSPKMALMRGSWSQCPAHRWVPRLLAAVWRSAAED